MKQPQVSLDHNGLVVVGMQAVVWLTQRLLLILVPCPLYNMVDHAPGKYGASNFTPC